MIELHNINKSYGKKQVLHNASFTIQKGKPLAIVGHNGAGKSTIIKIILSILQADSGKVCLSDDIHTIGYLPEERGVYRNESVLTHIKYFSELSGAKMTSHEIDAYLEKFEILRYKNFKLKDLSKGNAQKLQLALCFLGNPDLLILDEPFSGLDPLNRKVLSKILYEGSHERYIIFSSHQMTEIEQFCSDILILKKGEIKYFGGINELKELYQSKKIVEIIYRNSSNEIVREKTVSESNVLHWLKTNSTLDILNFSYGVPSLEEIYLEIMKE